MIKAQVRSHSLFAQVRTVTDHEGLFITWPTSYESLVGRAELKAGEEDGHDTSFERGADQSLR